MQRDMQLVCVSTSSPCEREGMSTTPNAAHPPLLDIDVIRVDDDTVRLSTDASWWNYNSAFGGWVAAVILEALTRHSDFRGEVITQQLQFIGPVAADEIDVTVHLLARRSTVDFWRVEVLDLDGALLVTAEMSSGMRTASDIGFEQSGPEVADGSGTLMELTEMHPTWTAHFEQIMIEGEPFTIAERPRSVVRARLANGVAFEPAALVMMCDSPMPRTFFASTEFVFPSTISLSIHTYASDEQIAAVGHEFVVVETDSAVIRNNALNQELHLYRGDGLLLACSYQTALFRPPSAVG